MYTILVLEDDEALNDTICYALKKEGYRVLTAHNCKEGISLLNANTFDFAIG